MKSKILFIISLFISVLSISQTRIKTMTYNLMHYPESLVYNPSTGTYVDRTPNLKAILDTYQPDLFMVCELGSATGADQILYDALQTDDNRYNRANFAYNQSSTYTDLQQLVFYNTQKLQLVYEDIILTDIRDINHYTFQLVKAPQTVTLDIFVAHLKSSNGTIERATRLEMVQRFTDYLGTIPSDHYVLFTGDFNLYTSSEPAYQEILDPTNAIVMVDPINRPGDWSNNYLFADIHTQSPLTTSYHFERPGADWEGVTGGMDDRFDFIMISQNMQNPSASLKYVDGTYKAYGNKGNCFNSYISDPNCAGEFSQELRDLLFNMSDHIPVVMEMETPYSLHNDEFVQNGFVRFNSSNVSSDAIELSISENLLETRYQIYNPLGQTVKSALFKDISETIDISNLSDGVYFIKVQNGQEILKFIKI